MAQWIGMCVAMQDAWVRSPVQKDATGSRALKPVSHHYVGTHSPVRSSPCPPQPEKARAQQRRPSASKNQINNLKKKRFKFKKSAISVCLESDVLMPPLLKCSLLKGIYCNRGSSLVAEPVENLPAMQETGM